jgi:integrase
MPRRKNVQPAYLEHRPTGQAYCRIPDGSGNRKTIYLGAFGSPESKAEYRRVLAELDSAPTPAAVLKGGHASAANDITVSELYLAFWKHAQQHYRREDGTPTIEVVEFKLTFRVVLALYGSTPAREFGPLALKAVRAKMVEEGLARTTINNRIRRLRHVFKWAAGEQLLPPTVHQALACVAGLQRGRSAAPEPEPVGPVADEVVDATLPHLNRHVRGLIQFQRLTGCRPGEACVVRRCDIDTSGSVWLFRPMQHKTAWRGKSRLIAIGPRAQQLLKQYLTDDPSQYLFNPRRAVEEFRSAKSANRKTPRYPSHMKRNEDKLASKPKRVPRERYTPHAVNVALRRAVERANAAQIKATVKVEQHLPYWHPNQLRHSFATLVRKEFDLEAAQVLLGHERCDVTQVYAERNLSRAAQVAAAIG